MPYKMCCNCKSTKDGRQDWMSITLSILAFSAWWIVCTFICATGLLSGIVPVWGGSLWQCSCSDPVLCGRPSAHLPGLGCCDLPPNHTDPSSPSHHWTTQVSPRWQKCKRTHRVQQKAEFELHTCWLTPGHQSTAKVGDGEMQCNDQKHGVCLQLFRKLLMDIISCLTGLEVTLLTWRMLEGGLHCSQHSLTATCRLVCDCKHADCTNP